MPGVHLGGGFSVLFGNSLVRMHCACGSKQKAIKTHAHQPRGLWVSTLPGVGTEEPPRPTAAAAAATSPNYYKLLGRIVEHTLSSFGCNIRSPVECRPRKKEKNSDIEPAPTGYELHTQA